ncbi:MAG: hypothetical protein HFH68_12865 [Lachnospiraceae bacterium]|nr:hypothetical protein [Lachnospiraceae bacterium]
MPVPVSGSFMNYEISLQRTPLKRYSALSPVVLRSKAGNSNVATNPYVKSNKGKNGDIKGVQNNSGIVNSNAGKKAVTRGSEIFYNNHLLKTSNDKSYIIDGAEFSSEEVDAVRSVLQNAVSPLLGGKLYYDYKDYAEMGIAENTVAKYAAENLTEKQAEVVNQSLSGYIDNLLSNEEDWLDSECYIDETEGIGDTGEMNTYYGVRHYTPQWMRDEMNAALAKFNTGRKGINSKEVSDTNSVEGKNGSFIYCASNKELAKSIRSLFSETDIMDSGQLADTFKQYKGMLKAAYQAVGFGKTTNERLTDDTNSFTKQISNMKAVFSGINRNGVDRIF